jgi:hypothetical protein
LEYAIVCLAALVVAALTLFSGFGLGSLMMPVFALFFPVEMAIAATAIVHLANNLFKLLLVGRFAVLSVVLRFGLPAALAAVFGAVLLRVSTDMQPLGAYVLAGRTFEILPITLVIGLLIVIFAGHDLLPTERKLTFERSWLPVGGALAGFFGGLSGHQGALRSAFLIRAGLSRDAFVGTAVVCAVFVDVVRLPIYGYGFIADFLAGTSPASQGNLPGLILAATLAAFIGSFLGSRLIKKVTIRSLEVIVGAMLLIMGPLLALGIIG